MKIRVTGKPAIAVTVIRGVVCLSLGIIAILAQTTGAVIIGLVLIGVSVIFFRIAGDMKNNIQE